jgi:hypothetical protein
MRVRILDLALNKAELSPRELADRFTKTAIFKRFLNVFLTSSLQNCLWFRVAAA